MLSISNFYSVIREYDFCLERRLCQTRRGDTSCLLSVRRKLTNNILSFYYYLTIIILLLSCSSRQDEYQSRAEASVAISLNCQTFYFNSNFPDIDLDIDWQTQLSHLNIRICLNNRSTREGTVLYTTIYNI